MEKIKISGIINDGKYNYLILEKSEPFLDNLQDFVVDIGLVKIDSNCPYEYEGKSYDLATYYTLFDECHSIEDSRPRKRSISEFDDGKVVRYLNKEIELLIIFTSNNINLIFYCDLNNRKKIMDLRKFRWALAAGFAIFCIFSTIIYGGLITLCSML